MEQSMLPVASAIENKNSSKSRKPYLPLRPRQAADEENVTGSETDIGWLLVDMTEVKLDGDLVEIMPADAIMYEAEEEEAQDERQSPLFVHAKQYQRILKRRAARERLEDLLQSRPPKVPVLSYGCLRRPRSRSGRLLKAEEVEQMEQEKRVQECADKASEKDNVCTSNGDKNDEDGEGDTDMLQAMEDEKPDVGGEQSYPFRNAKQYQRILKRRAARQKLEEMLRSQPPRTDLPFRRAPAQRRPRSPSGRFLAVEEIEQKRTRDSMDGLAAGISKSALDEGDGR